MTHKKSCEVCAAPLDKRRGETRNRWLARRFCSTDCQITSMRGVPISQRSKPFRQPRSYAMRQGYYDPGYGAPVTVPYVRILDGDPYWSPRMKRVEV